MSIIFRRTTLRLTTTSISRSLLFRPTTAFITTRTMAVHQTLTDAIKEDHREMYDYYDQYVRASGDNDAQARWARQLIWEVARHAVGEEIVVYPLMEKYLGENGAKLTNQDREEHQYAKERLYRIESLQPGSAEHASLLKDIMDHLREHNDSEEKNDLPLLEPHLGAEGSIAAATSFSRTKKFVPTRSHPSAPNKPPFETLAGLLAAPIDKLKDAFSKFPTDEMMDQGRH